MSIFDLGKDRKNMNFGKDSEAVAKDILKWSKGNLSKEELEKKHEKSLGWFGGAK